MPLKVIGMVATLDGKIVPLETPHAEPWYEIDCEWHGYRVVLTDGDKYCWRNASLMEDVEPLEDGEPLVSDRRFDIMRNPKWIELVRNAIERYHKEIGI